MRKLTYALLTLAVIFSVSSCSTGLLSMKQGGNPYYVSAKKVKNHYWAVYAGPAVNSFQSTDATREETPGLLSIPAQGDLLHTTGKTGPNPEMLGMLKPHASTLTLTGVIAPAAAASMGVKSETTVTAASPHKSTHAKPGGGNKSQLVALLLCIFLGGLGIHRFYLGYYVIGVIQLLTAGGCGIWWLIDLIRLIMGDLKPADGSDYKDAF